MTAIHQNRDVRHTARRAGGAVAEFSAGGIEVPDVEGAA
jgi:hypothetical protein